MDPRHAGHLVDGRWEYDGDYVDVTDPGTGDTVGALACGTPDHARRSVDAAARAFPRWADTTARERADLLLAAAHLVENRADEIGQLLAAEAGKRLPEAVGEVRFSAEDLRWFAEQARRPDGAVLPHEAPGRRHLTLRRPAGSSSA